MARRRPLQHDPLCRCHQVRPRRNTNGDRLLTVASCVNPNRYDDRDTFLPMIRIRGRWLRKLGFAVGKRFAVKVEGKQLVLSIEKE